MDSELTFREKLEDAWEELKVKWFLMDAAEKQAIIIVLAYLAQVAIDLFKAYIQARMVTGNES